MPRNDPMQIPPAPTSRAVWIALIVLAATIIGATAGLLAHASGSVIPAAILVGGGAFFSATLFLLQLLAYATGGKSA